ncbi:MAG: GAF domain-containing protein [Myxococcales bacterium]|nr:GAF domain-containing protein [Myxococcales bacterium]
MSHDFYRANGPVDLSRCHEEPIHIPGAIQPHGVLLACSEPELVVHQASANCTHVFGRPMEELLGARVEQLLGSRAALRLRANVETQRRMLDPLRVETLHGAFELLAHRTNDALVVELEPAHPPPSLGGLRAAFARLRHATSIEQLCHVAAQEVRALSGFDRVMIYRFDERWDGEVLAEARHEELSTFLGLRYPAADIPEQARRLYALNPLRLIHDVDYEPSPIVPELDPRTARPLDLSGSMLRSVSPVHIVYLRNMDVRASMSISILVGERLWGLIACHHREPIHPSPQVRWACELLGHNLAMLIDHAQQAEHHAQEARASRECTRIMARLSTSDDRPAALLERHAELRAAFDVDAIALVEPDRILVGDPAPPVALLELLRDEGIDDTLVATDELSQCWPQLTDTLGGALVLELNRDRGQLLVLYRRALVQTVTWGSRPDKQVSVVDGHPRLSPEGSFQLWKQTIRERCRPWRPWELDAAHQLRQGYLELEARQLVVLEDLNEQLLHATHAREQFLATLSHELRNPLNAIIGWSRLLRDESLDAKQQARAIEVIHRNAEVQRQLIEDLLDVSRVINGKMTLSVRLVDLLDVVRAAADTLATAIRARGVQLSIEGWPGQALVDGDPDRLQQVAWNLLSNATKFSPKHAAITVTVRSVGSSVELRVADRGEGIDPDQLPRVFDRFHQVGERRRGGLGLGLAIVKGIVELHGGTVLALSPGKGHGSTFVVRLPVAALRPGSGRRAPEGLEHPAMGTALAGLRILCVDDQPEVTEMLRLALEREGAEVHEAHTVQAAAACLEQTPYHAVLSDIELGGGQGGTAVVDAVRASALSPEARVVALTGHAGETQRARILEAGFDEHLSKPVSLDELVSLLATLHGATPSGGTPSS